ncbi:MAG TPA: substrate-binding domain-containing protein [Solirubrobacteraceae bacterium]|nr:substrate-binding domain-containing protein [Solirubrobacteraceae bacterium]
MSRYSKLRRVAMLAACVGCTSVVASLGVTAPAGAFPLKYNETACIPTADTLHASGSSFQLTLDETLKASWAANSKCAKAVPTIKYTATSSGKGREVFGSTGVLLPEKDKTVEEIEKGTKNCEGPRTAATATPKEACLDVFIGTDAGPSTAELQKMTEANGGKSKTGRGVVTVPIAQGPVAFMLSLPAGCEIEPGSKIDLNNVTAQQIWLAQKAEAGKEGEIEKQGGYPAATWGALLTQLGYKAGAKATGKEFTEASKATCGEEKIKPVIRSSSSGTTFATQNYFNQIDPGQWAYALTTGGEVNWPEGGKTPVGYFKTLTCKGENTTGQLLAENTSGTPGAIGYADTSDAQKYGGFTELATSRNFCGSASHQILWAQVQNTGTGAAPNASEYVNPLVSGSKANCETNKLIAGDKEFPKHWNETWVTTLASDPDIQSEDPAAYPACAFTFDVALHHYKNSNLYLSTATAEEMAATAHDYLRYATGPEGKAALEAGGYYVGAPAAMAGYIKAAVENVGY